MTTVTANCGTTITALFIYLNVCLSVMWNSSSCPFPSIYGPVMSIYINIWVPHVEHVLPTLPGYLSSPSIFIEVRDARFLDFYVLFSRSLFVRFLLTIVSSVLLQFPGWTTPLISSNFSHIINILEYICVTSCVLLSQCIDNRKHKFLLYCFRLEKLNLKIIHTIQKWRNSLMTKGAFMMMIVWYSYIQLHMQLVPITTKVVSSNPS